MSHNVVVLNEVLYNMGKADSQYPDQDAFNTMVGLMAHYVCGQLSIHPAEHPDQFKTVSEYMEMVLSQGAYFVATEQKLGGDGMCPNCDEYCSEIPDYGSGGVSDVAIYKTFVESFSRFITLLRNQF